MVFACFCRVPREFNCCGFVFSWWSPFSGLLFSLQSESIGHLPILVAGYQMLRPACCALFFCWGIDIGLHWLATFFHVPCIVRADKSCFWCSIAWDSRHFAGLKVLQYLNLSFAVSVPHSSMVLLQVATSQVSIKDLQGEEMEGSCAASWTRTIIKDEGEKVMVFGCFWIILWQVFFEDRVRLQNVPVTEWSKNFQRPSPSGRIFALMQWCRMKCQIKCRLCLHWHSSYGWMCCSWNVARWGSQTNFVMMIFSMVVLSSPSCSLILQV